MQGGDDEFCHRRRFDIGADGFIELPMAQMQRQTAPPVSVNSINPLAQIFIKFRRPRCQPCQRTTAFKQFWRILGTKAIHLPHHHRQDIIRPVKRPQPHTINILRQAFLDHGMGKFGLAGEMMIKRALGRAGPFQDLIDRCPGKPGHADFIERRIKDQLAGCLRIAGLSGRRQRILRMVGNGIFNRALIDRIIRMGNPGQCGSNAKGRFAHDFYILCHVR